MMSDDWWVVGDKSFVSIMRALHRNMGLYMHFSLIFLTCTRRIYGIHPRTSLACLLLFILQNCKTATRTRNPGLEIVVRVLKPQYERWYKTVSGNGRPNFNVLTHGRRKLKVLASWTSDKFGLTGTLLQTIRFHRLRQSHSHRKNFFSLFMFVYVTCATQSVSDTTTNYHVGNVCPNGEYLHLTSIKGIPFDICSQNLIRKTMRH